MNDKEIFNNSSFAAIQCSKNNVKANQISQLLSIFNTNLKRDINYTIMMIIAFVMKQTERGYFGNESAKAIKETLKSILDQQKDNNQKTNEVREYLGLLKWFYGVTTSKKIRVKWDTPIDKAFKEIIESFQKRR